MRITNNFKLSELTFSKTAQDKGIINEPNKDQIENLRKLTVRLLQPLRSIHNEPFIINSGFRSEELNKAVKGAKNSQHMKGQAVDIHVKEPRRLLRELLKSRLPFDQAILYDTFLHLSYNSANNRKQVLYAKGVNP